MGQGLGLRGNMGAGLIGHGAGFKWDIGRGSEGIRGGTKEGTRRAQKGHDMEFRGDTRRASEDTRGKAQRIHGAGLREGQSGRYVRQVRRLCLAPIREIKPTSSTEFTGCWSARRAVMCDPIPLM